MQSRHDRANRASGPAGIVVGTGNAAHAGDRTLDVDILLYDDRVVATRRLQIPHPRLTARAFALVPLIEVAPGQSMPDGRSLVQVVAGLAPIDDVVMVGRQVVAP